jgi:hypothetical protein
MIVIFSDVAFSYASSPSRGVAQRTYEKTVSLAG